ncbi:MAG: hypothetical protein K2N36_07215 [Ruminiclostridium sp.]|nr:hypothetical protein [Ruminiclostridium sp.]
MDDINIAKFSLSIKSGIAQACLSKKTKNKIAAIISMAEFSISEIAKTENFSSDVLLFVLANEIMNKVAADYALKTESSEKETTDKAETEKERGVTVCRSLPQRSFRSIRA